MSSGMKSRRSMDKELLQLDIKGILKGRLPKWYARLIPGPLYAGLAGLIKQDDLNAILREAYPAEGAAFCRRVFEILNIEIETVGLDRIADGRYIFASNHPLGGLDGLALIAALASRFGDERVVFPVNDMLMNVTPLASVFVPINKYGNMDRQKAGGLNEAFASDSQVAIFPAGLVSRLGNDGKVRDLIWRKTFAGKAIEYGRDIVPVRIEAQNRSRFYKIADLRKQLGLKLNLEQVLLPAELVAARGMKIRIIFGDPQNIGMLTDALRTPTRISQHIRSLSDRLEQPSRN